MAVVFYMGVCLRLESSCIRVNMVITFTLLLYIAVNTTIMEYNTNATCFDLQ